jgi:hypothetical protein
MDYDGCRDDDDDDDDVNAYLNTACSQDLYMPAMDPDEEAFRNQDEQPIRRRNTVTQRLTFQGLEDTPPEAGDPAQVRPAGTIFSPGTLHKTILGSPPAPPTAPPAPAADQTASKKKHRKRPDKKKAKATGHQILADDVPRPSKDGLTRLHEAGKLIFSPDEIHNATGPMVTLQNIIRMLEGMLLKDDCPNYPVFTVKVPAADPDFVHEDPADVFFIAYEDVFNLFHSRRLNYNLVRLYALSEQIKIQRERPPYVAVADPYYMRDSQLVEGSSTRTKAVKYLESFMLRNIDKNTILLPVFPE